MEKSILIPLLFLCIIPFASAQKISSLDYKLKSVDSSYVITAKAFSDETIQKKTDKIFSTIIPDKSIISIEDNINRRFDKINFKNIDYYSKLLNEGYFNLYELKVNDKPTYIVYSKNDTVVLEKNDTVIDNIVIGDREYNKRLVFLCKDYPELLKVARRANFKKEALQNLISVLNEKHGGKNIKKPVISKIDYLSFSLSGIVTKNKTNLNLGVLKSQYLLNLSTNLSLKYGLLASYYHRISYFPIGDREYNKRLVFLCKDYPELLKVARRANFKKEALQNLISVLNEKHGGKNIKKPVISKIDYLSFSLSGIVTKNKTNLNLGVLKSQYLLNLSTNLSLKYGLLASYYHRISYFPDLTPGWAFSYETEEELQNFYNAHKNDHDTMTDIYLGVPLMLNYEITNSTITPYFNLGFEPLLYSHKLTRSYSNQIDKSNGIAVLPIVAVGVKVKLTNSFNILSEFRLLTGLNVGMEYFLKL